MSQTLYRKYRPKKLSDVLGQLNNVEILKGAAKSGRLGQAYLFYGPRGTGKTTTARLIAKLANCEKRRTDENFRKLGEPCNECAACRAIDEGANFDVVEIDAASNRGIDEIRNLKEAIRVSPVNSPYKIYIIDEAHMLTKEAMNALLKTLEEPPSYAIMILATTEYEKMPPTIVSRTQRFIFKKATKNEILEKLKMIAKNEEAKISDDALELVAAAGEGSFRDAESLLEQVLSLGEKIDVETAERLIGRTGFKKTSELAGVLMDKNLNSALELISRFNEEGINFTQLTKDLIHYLRKVLTLKLDPQIEESLKSELTAEEAKKIKAQAQNADSRQLVDLLKSLLEAYTEIRYSPFGFVPLEVAIIENLNSVEKNRLK
ncbi:MAG: DNA polymerase III subunit gamma/tau [Patescibacteria group bacterium]|nr:DNA polymerase III subunit gamma/tau [Patescibacteria group bacterium]